MIGRYWMYKTTVYHFQSLNTAGNTLTIAAEPKWLTIAPEALAGFIKECKRVDDGRRLPDKQPPAQIQIKALDENAGDLISMMKENIKRVQKDPEYAKQAKQVTASARVILDVARLELSVHKLVNKNNES